jgi:GTP cyclohydrolase I
MKDIQNQEDHRRINIKKVGVKTISYPITVLDKAHSKQYTIASVNMYVNLPHHFKGTHMSRFVEILNRYHGAIDIGKFHNILEEMKGKLEAEAAHIEMSFAYFMSDSKGAGGLKTRRYECCMHGSLRDVDDLEFRVDVPVSIPVAEQLNEGLPRSFGHWGRVLSVVRFRNFIWIEDLITLIEKAIENAHKISSLPGGNGMSVESLCKYVAKSLEEEKAIQSFSLKVENLAEGYSTFAAIESLE